MFDVDRELVVPSIKGSKLEDVRSIGRTIGTVGSMLGED